MVMRAVGWHSRSSIERCRSQRGEAFRLITARRAIVMVDCGRFCQRLCGTRRGRVAADAGNCGPPIALRSWFKHTDAHGSVRSGIRSEIWLESLVMVHRWDRAGVLCRCAAASHAAVAADCRHRLVRRRCRDDRGSEPPRHDRRPRRSRRYHLVFLTAVPEVDDAAVPLGGHRERGYLARRVLGAGQQA